MDIFRSTDDIPLYKPIENDGFSPVTSDEFLLCNRRQTHCILSVEKYRSFLKRR